MSSAADNQNDSDKAVEERAADRPQVRVSRQAHSIAEAKQITRARVRDLRSLISKYGRKHLPERVPE